MSAPSAYRIVPAASEADLRGILALQAANLPDAVPGAERASQGFVTLRHDLDLLREMNAPWPHVVAKLGEEVVGYALVMLPALCVRFPELEPMLRRIEALPWRDAPLVQSRYYVMGQVCIAKGHRGRGLLERLYAEHRARLGREFDVCVTEISLDNPRSRRAHERVGFVELEAYAADDGSRWSIVALAL